MKLSAHNIISRIADSDNYFIINLLSQQADIINPEDYQILLSGNYENQQDFISKGYIVDPSSERNTFQKKYLEFLKNRDNDEIQLFFVPGYSCNFSCFYCYQEEYAHDYLVPSEQMIDAFFNFILEKFKTRKKYITLFGGEPLINTSKHRSFIEYFIQSANSLNLDLAIVTNGYYLEDYIGLLKEASIREIQVTLDGVAAVHDARRPLKNGGSTFYKIVSGIDKALEAGLHVNLRTVVDKNNLNELTSLAHFAIDKGWTRSSLFKTQVGRNYELHNCQADSANLYSRIELYRDLYRLINEHPEILEFHKPSFSISRFLFENGELPFPLYDSCPGTKTEWAFDFTGKVYSCTATVGKKDEMLGTFFPEVSLNTDLIESWENRDVLSIQECRNCSLQLACGGGCASIAKNRSKIINSPDCRPIKELLELGMSFYFINNVNTNDKGNKCC